MIFSQRLNEWIWFKLIQVIKCLHRFHPSVIFSGCTISLSSPATTSAPRGPNCCWTDEGRAAGWGRSVGWTSRTPSGLKCRTQCNHRTWWRATCWSQTNRGHTGNQWDTARPPAYFWSFCEVFTSSALGSGSTPLGGLAEPGELAITAAGCAEDSSTAKREWNHSDYESQFCSLQKQSFSLSSSFCTQSWFHRRLTCFSTCGHDPDDRQGSGQRQEVSPLDALTGEHEDEDAGDEHGSAHLPP